MRINPEHKLRRLGSHHMIVDACADNANLTNIYALNSTAAFLWERAAAIGEFTPETLVDLLLINFSGVSPDQARADVDNLLGSWREYDLVVD